MALLLLAVLPQLVWLALSSDVICDGSAGNDTDDEAATLLQLYGNVAAHAAAKALTSEVEKVAFVFTTGCGGEYQLYQSAVLEHTWKVVGNTGTLTRVMNGCKSESEQREASRSPLEGDPRFFVFTAPGDLAVNPRTGTTYPARGRPWSLMLWLAAGMPPWSAQKPPNSVAILDPDFAMLRPLTSHPQFKEVRHGQMLAATYDMGGDWIKYFSQIGEPKPALTEKDALDQYSSGPPWVVERGDFEAILPQWGQYTDKLDEKEHTLLNEQYAFLMAAAHHRVPMLPDGNTMVVSNLVSYREVWTGQDDPADWDKTYLLHYCMSVNYKGWSWHKSLVTKTGWYGELFGNPLSGILDCSTPGLVETPQPPSMEEEPNKDLRRWAWFLHRLIPKINEGTSAFRNRYCFDKPLKSDSMIGVGIRTVQPLVCDKKKTTMYLVSKSEPTTWDFQPEVCSGERQSAAPSNLTESR